MCGLAMIRSPRVALLCLTTLCVAATCGLWIWQGDLDFRALKLKLPVLETSSQRYIPPDIAGRDLRPGRDMEISDTLLRELELPFRDFVDLNEDTVQDFVFATASSQNHFIEGLDGVASIQEHFPDYKVFYYDIGLTNSEVEQVKQWCGVTYRTFNYTKFPPHVTEIKKYAWKPLIVQELLTEFGGVFWMDASVRLHSNNLTSLYSHLLSNGGISLPWTTNHNNHVVTHPTSYEYLPSDQNKQLETNQAGATTFIVFKTREIYWNILHWWFLCSLQNNCIAPVAKARCTTQQRRDTTFAGCHRFDQGTINILSSNYFGYDVSRYSQGRHEGFLNIQREATAHYQLKWCKERR